ncbi:MAG TPA: PGPGW domain-containing protein [Egibacteraceae bacterium]
MTAGSHRPRFRRRSARLAWKSGVFLVGIALAVAGAAMLVLPGPGLLVIALGLLVLATEFHWAQRLKQRVTARLARSRRGSRTPS